MSGTVVNFNSPTGEFLRPQSVFRDWITADGSSGFKAEANRYHLYVSLACPWAHRTVIMRKLKGLEKVIGLTVVDPINTDNGWKFTDDTAKCELDKVNGCNYVKEVYALAVPGYDGRVTVPVLWDKTKKTIVNNESSEIIRMLNSEFNEFGETPEQKSLDLYPENLRTQIEEINDIVYNGFNNGVYKAGFATSQEAYETACRLVFQTLDKLEAILSTNRFLTGDCFTLADVRCFTTLARFDWVYHGLFKCNIKRLTELPNVWNYTRDLYNLYGVGETVDRDHIIRHYYSSLTLRRINPNGIYPIGPTLDYSIPKERRQKFNAT